MTAAEFELLQGISNDIGAVKNSLGRIDQRLTDHIEEEDRAWRRRAGLSPWLGNLISASALVVAALALLLR